MGKFINLFYLSHILVLFSTVWNCQSAHFVDDGRPEVFVFNTRGISIQLALQSVSQRSEFKREARQIFELIDG